MKRKNIFKSAALAVIATFVIGSLFSVKSSSKVKLLKTDDTSSTWVVNEIQDPYVDIDLHVVVDGVEILTEYEPSTGTFCTIPSGHTVEVYTTSSTSWPTGGSCTLRVFDASGMIYNHLTSTWSSGVIDYCSFTSTGDALHIQANCHYNP